MRERFVKLNGIIYYESQLELMSDNQLKALIKECQKGIEEIEAKSSDYRETNKDTDDIIHYQDVLNKFESASIYLQSDIVMIDKILKNRTTDSKIEKFSEKELLWYKTYYEESKNSLFWKRVRDKTNQRIGYEIGV